MIVTPSISLMRASLSLLEYSNHGGRLYLKALKSWKLRTKLLVDYDVLGLHSSPFVHNYLVFWI